MLLNELHLEVEKRVKDSNPEIVFDALQGIFEQISGLVSSNDCSYFINYKQYAMAQTAMTKLLRSYNPIDKARYNKIEKIAESIRDIRYSKVCGICIACKKRRKLWPIYTNFVKPKICIDDFI